MDWGHRWMGLEKESDQSTDGGWTETQLIGRGGRIDTAGRMGSTDRRRGAQMDGGRAQNRWKGGTDGRETTMEGSAGGTDFKDGKRAQEEGDRWKRDTDGRGAQTA